MQFIIDTSQLPSCEHGRLCERRWRYPYALIARPTRRESDTPMQQAFCKFGTKNITTFGSP